MSDMLRTQLRDQITKVDYYTIMFSVRELVTRVRDGLIDIAPEYQRQFRWDYREQSYLIESLFLGIPISALVFVINQDNTWDVIDGVQRINTIINFAGYGEAGMENSLKLDGLEKLSELNGKRLSDLPMDIQIRFQNAAIPLIVMSDRNDSNVRFDLYERLKRGGVSLTNQEIRNCVYRGPFHDFIKAMSENCDYMECVRLPEKKEHDGTREELILRFFAYLNASDFFSHSVKDFLNWYMMNANRRFDYETGRHVFTEVFKTLNKALPNGITRGINITPLNLFDAVSVGAARAFLKNGTICTDGLVNWIQDEELTNLTTGASASVSKVKERIDYCFRRFEGTPCLN